MKPLHFIETLIETYERAWSIIGNPALDAGFAPGLADVGVWAANQVAANRWQGQQARAGQIGAALMRLRYGADATAEALELDPWIQIAISATDDPPTREQLAAALPPGLIP